jgi:hypothetical protein
MERRFELRKVELLADCQVHPAVFAGMMERLDQLFCFNGFGTKPGVGLSNGLLIGQWQRRLPKS